MAKKSSRNVLVIGATSSLAWSLCEQMAKRGWNLVLAGRDEEELARMKNDMGIRYPNKIELCPCDLSDSNFSAEQVLGTAGDFFEINLLLIVAGDMGDPKLRADGYEIERIVRINYLSPIKLMASYAQKIEERGAGGMIVISSVAGDRGRQSNYTYGSTKGALSIYAAGLRNWLSSRGGHVLTIKPGFIDTPMAYTVKSGLVAPREKVAAQILAAFDARKNEVYIPFIWSLIMLIIRNIPEPIFKKMRL